MNNNTVNLKIDLRLVTIILLVIIAAMLAAWRPWQHTAAVTRKITISGESTVKATPDEFVFYPSFERTGSDVNSMKSDLNTFGTKLLAEVQKLGIAKSDIVLNSSAYDDYTPYQSTSDRTQTISLQVTITAHDQTHAQKVQDYLAGTDAKGQLTAQPQFSTSKQKQLENTARQQAIADARSKASKTASNVGAKLGKVLEVSDQSSGGIGRCSGNTLCPMAVNSSADASTKASLPVTPGNSDITQTVQVVFDLD